MESEHLVDACVVGVSGLVEAWGEPKRAIIPRSAIKPIQVLPLVASGAADAFSVTDEELALGAASHSGGAQHVEAVDRWLERIGLDRSALECGASRPLGVPEADQLLGSGGTFEAIHNCCSGKHAGFLTVAQHLGVDPAGYIDREHPVQQLVSTSIGEYTGVDVHERSSGIDGCGIPTFALPLEVLAGAMSRLVTIDDPAAKRVVTALAENPFWLSGSQRTEVRLTDASKEPLVIKTGAEGVFMAALPNRGVGIALKARDGATRAGDAAIAGVLGALGIVDASLAVTEITNRAGTVVGLMEVRLS